MKFYKVIKPHIATVSLVDGVSDDGYVDYLLDETDRLIFNGRFVYLVKGDNRKKIYETINEKYHIDFFIEQKIIEQL